MKVFFAGSFNPFTIGHADIVKRLLHLGHSVVIGIGANIEKASSRELADKNAFRIMDWIMKEDIGKKVEVRVYGGVTAEAAKHAGAKCLVRGVRNATDFDYEYSMAAMNREAFGIETILLPADPSLSIVSSTMIRDLEQNDKGDIASHYLP